MPEIRLDNSTSSRHVPLSRNSFKILDFEIIPPEIEFWDDGSIFCGPGIKEYKDEFFDPQLRTNCEFLFHGDENARKQRGK